MKKKKENYLDYFEVTFFFGYFRKELSVNSKN